jgi:membrane protease YdiL (CAAX protease family)
MGLKRPGILQEMTMDNTVDRNEPVHRLGLFVVFLVLGLVAYMPEALSPAIRNNVEIPLRIGLTVLFLAVAILINRSRRLKLYGPVLYAMFVVSIAQFVDWHFSGWAPRLLNVDLETPAGYAIDKLESALLSVLTILAFVKLSGRDLASLYLKRGKVRSWLIIGLGTFAFFAATSLLAAEGLFGGQDLSVERVLPWIPWILIFVLANGLNEELLFRGLGMQRLESFLGPFLSNLLITVIFIAWHLGADYTSDMIVFSAIIGVLGFAWGHVVQKTDSLWGAVLFHAGADIPVIIALLSVL